MGILHKFDKQSSPKHRHTDTQAPLEKQALITNAENTKYQKYKHKSETKYGQKESIMQKAV